jgi:hypothetical protein
MTDQYLKNLIAFIEDPNYTVLWNDGYDKYMLLNNIVHRYDDEIKVFFTDHRPKYVDLNNVTCHDFLYFKKVEFKDLLEEKGL